MKLSTKFVSKSWGYEEIIVNNQLYCGKILFVKRNKYCSFHFHLIKTETFHILDGSILLYYSDDDFNKCKTVTLVKGDTFHIPVGLRHRFFGLEDSRILEISTHHEDSDSIRILPSCPVDF